MQPTGLSLDGGTLQTLPGGASLEQISAVLNDVIIRLNSQLQTQIYADTTNKRMLIGYQKDGWGSGNDFGIKISIAGKDVTTATDDELLFRMALDNWQWRNDDGVLIREFDIAGGLENNYTNTSHLIKQFNLNTGTEAYYDLTARNYVNIGLRPSTNTVGFEMAKPGVDLGNEPI